MYVCICNPFTDKTVKTHLQSCSGKVKVSDTYTACSGGEKMNCGTCACELKKMVDTHNNGLTIEAINDQMTKVTEQEKETV